MATEEQPSPAQKRETTEKTNMRGFAQLLAAALNRALENPEKPWMNRAGLPRPSVDGVKGLNPFTSLTLTLDADMRGYESSRYAKYDDLQKAGFQVRKGQRSFPLLSYNYPDYVNRTNPADKITADAYWKLPAGARGDYKGVRERYFRPYFNYEQTTIMEKEAELGALRDGYGSQNQRGRIAEQAKVAKRTVAAMVANIGKTLATVAYADPDPKKGADDAVKDARREAAGQAAGRYVPAAQGGMGTIVMPRAKEYGNFVAYAQDFMRQAVAATGSSEHLDRKGMVMRGGLAPSWDDVAYEKLVQEVASAYKMTELGLPARIAPGNMQYARMWKEEIETSPSTVDALEADVNNALAVLAKAERGQELESAMARNQKRAMELFDKSAPRVSSREGAVVADLLAHHGMRLDPRNFPDEGSRQEFGRRFPMTETLPAIEASMEAAKAANAAGDSELAEYAYTEAENLSESVRRSAGFEIGNGWAREENRAISDGLVKLPSLKERRIVVVADDETGIHDVVLPSGAARGGAVYASGKRLPFYSTADEAMSKEDRKALDARVEYSNPRGMSKDRIAAELYKGGASYVRFFNPSGTLKFQPDDAYFQGKRAYAATVTSAGVSRGADIPLEDRVRAARVPEMKTVGVVKLGPGYAVVMNPKDEPPFGVQLSREDQNRYWTTVRQNRKADTDAVKREMAEKYYNEARLDPSKRIERDVLFPAPSQEADLSNVRSVQFQKVDDKYWAAPTLKDGGKVTPREITKTQFDLMYSAPVKEDYRLAVASHIYKDLFPRKTEGVSVAQAVEREREVQRDNREHEEYHLEADQAQQGRETEHAEYHDDIDSRERREEARSHGR